MFQSSVRLAALISLGIAAATPAFAQQEDPRFALVASFPSPTVSLQWEVNDRFAIRLDGSYTFSDETSHFEIAGPERLGGLRLPSTTASLQRTSHTGSVAFVGLLRLHSTDRIRLYLAPRVLIGWSRQTLTETETQSNGANTFVWSDNSTQVTFGLPGASGPQTSASEMSSTTPGAGLLFGARSNVFDRVALFGEAGLMYSRSDTPRAGATSLAVPTISNTGAQRTSVYTRAVAGLMFLF